MPYNPGTGVYSLPAVYLATPGTTILATQHNTPLEDLEVANNYARPIIAGGTGASDAASARTNLGVSVFAVGSVIDFAGVTAPSLWLLSFGQAISRSTYSALFAIVGTLYGVGDGTTTFNVPDLRGRVVAGQDDMGGVSANRLTSPLDGDTMGAAGGAESVVLSTANLAAHAHGPGTLAGITGNASTNHQHGGGPLSGVTGASQTAVQGGAANGGIMGTDQPSGSLHTHVVDVNTGSTASSGSGTAHANVQPTIILNKIIYAGV